MAKRDTGQIGGEAFEQLAVGPASFGLQGLEASGSLAKRRVRVSAPGPATSSRGRVARAHETVNAKRRRNRGIVKK